MKKIFSVPLNPKLTDSQFNDYLAFLQEYKDYIYDLYVTCRIPPFMQDAMGDVFRNSKFEQEEFQKACYVNHVTGIPLSPTFNNIQVRPTQQFLDLFIHNFSSIYDEEIVHSATIPHTHWVATGLIQDAFPKLQIKNTILRNVTEPREVVKLAEAGFHYVNLDRDLMRDLDKLKELKRAKEYAGVKLSLLANEGCLGNCPMMDEHYEFNNTRMNVKSLQVFNNTIDKPAYSTPTPQYFADPISRVSCDKWDAEDLSVPFKTANFPPWKEDWDELLEYVDVIKMHGREAPHRLNETMHIIKNYAENKEILYDEFDEWIEDKDFKKQYINAWRKKIKTCRFECWDCNYCDKVFESKPDLKQSDKVLQVTGALVDSASHNFQEVQVPGLTSKRVGSLLNALARHSNHFLEIGSMLGKSTCSVLWNNEIKVSCVDNWSENLQPMTEKPYELPDNKVETFIENVKTYKENNEVKVYQCDLFETNTDKINNVDLFFYDGPMHPEAVYNSLHYYNKTFADEVICIYDDANDPNIVMAVDEAREQIDFDCLYAKLLLNDMEDDSMYWNGVYVFVLKRKENNAHTM